MRDAQAHRNGTPSKRMDSVFRVRQQSGMAHSRSAKKRMRRLVCAHARIAAHDGEVVDVTLRCVGICMISTGGSLLGQAECRAESLSAEMIM